MYILKGGAVMQSMHELNLVYPTMMSQEDIIMRARKILFLVPAVFVFLGMIAGSMLCNNLVLEQQVALIADMGYYISIIFILMKDKNNFSPMFLGLVGIAFAVLSYLDVQGSTDLTYHNRLVLAMTCFYVLGFLILNQSDNYLAIGIFSVVAGICSIRYLVMLLVVLYCYTNTYSGTKFSRFCRRYRILIRVFGFGLILASVGNMFLQSKLIFVLGYGALVNLCYCTFKSYFLSRCRV